MKIVQVGACIGNDHVTELVTAKKNVEFLLLIEPNIKALPRLQDCYKSTPNVVIENVAIVPDYSTGTSVEMFFSERDAQWGYQVTSMFKSHLEKHLYNTNEIESFNVPCSTLTDVLSKYNISYLDYLFIDIEGIDAQVLLSLDLNKYDIKYICIEVLHLTDETSVYEFLKKHGYVETYTSNKFDKMFIKLDKMFVK
jgi:FkbM family methyltransferase